MYSTIHLLEIMRRSAFKSPLSLHPLRGECLGLAVEEGERLGFWLVLLPQEYREGT